MSEPLTNLKRKPRPVPSFKGIRPFPWLLVHPAGHPHEGHPIERETWCDEPAGDGESGSICGAKFLQQQIDPEWLARRSAGVQAAFDRQLPLDADGIRWTPTACPRCERAKLDAERPGEARDFGPPRSWYDNLPPDAEPPTTEDLFGGSMA